MQAGKCKRFNLIATWAHYFLISRSLCIMVNPMANGIPAPLEKKYKQLNNIMGWLVFLIAAYIYWNTIEPTASFWDCSEFIAIDYKLQIGHPPGAPFLQLMAHLVSLLAGHNVHKVASYINRMSATCSALTIMFLFWTTTWFAKKLVMRNGEFTEGKMYAILGCGLIGALAYTFTDSFWFSAVEGEVYAMSSCFTAMVFWCILKWERAHTHAERWLVLSFYLVGLSIGVHLLCLLTLPAVVYIYYFKAYPDGLHSKWISKLLSPVSKSKKMQGAIVAGIVAVILLGGIQAWLIPGIIQMAAYFEIFFVNTAHLPFNSGTLIYALTLLVLIMAALIITKKRRLPGWNTAVLAFTMLLIGYSTFLILVLRSDANTPMNENAPDDAVHLHAYLGRQEYGDWPLLYGPYYNSPLDTTKPYKDGEPVYSRDEKTGRYVITNNMKAQVPNYYSKFCTLFPRMWDGSEQDHIQGYKNWGGIDFNKIPYTEAGGRVDTIGKPTFFDNLTYFVKYQNNFMFWRYFMWNFCGRQNDIQGNDAADNLHGNWITGIPFLDALHAPQKNMPKELAENKGRNPMYGLPLLLGLLGLIYQYRKDKENTLVIAVFFFFTGLAIILYLNQAPYQPRERDYSYVGAFYAFAIWIGIGVLGIYELMNRILNKVRGKEKQVALAATFISLVVPVIMAHAEWNDHDRSGRCTCRDFAIDYLESCAPNAILFTNGDNDTFPLWYAQEVEGIRTDVRVCNLNLLGSAWYIDQMKRRTYKSAPLPISMTRSQYEDGTREYVPVFDNKRGDGYTDLKELIDFVKSDKITDMVSSQSGQHYNYFPTNRFEIKVNDTAALINSGAIPQSLRDSILPAVDWTMPGDYVLKNTLAVLDLVAHNNWKRPIYFGVSTGSAVYMGLEPYFQLEGMAYRLVPVKNHTKQDIRVATGIMYDNVMHKFKWGNMHSGIYMDENIRDMARDMRIELAALAQALIDEHKNDSASKVLNLCMDSIPEKNCPYKSPVTTIVYEYYQIGQYAKADTLAKEVFNINENDVKYYHSLNKWSANYYKDESDKMELILYRLAYLAKTYKQDVLAKSFQRRLSAIQAKELQPE